MLTGAEVINNGCMFLRNLILARILSKGDFGVAASLGLVVSLFELASKLSFGQQVIQSPAGEEPQFEETAHACQALAGTLSAALILLFSYPISHCFGMGAHWGAFMLLAVIPICIGFSSLEVNRMVRHLRLGPLVLTDTVPQVATTLAAWPLAAWLRDYRAILCLLLGKAAFSLTMSHLLAERPYRLCWNRQLILGSLRFGWPLLASSFVMFGVFQGDQMLVAGAYSMSDLGIYAVAATLAMAPCAAIFKISGTAALSVMASAQNNLRRFRVCYSTFAQGLALFSALFVVTMILAGQAVVTLLFGQKYREAGALAAWLAVGQAIRILRGAPACAALAKGDTVNTLLGNLTRLSGLALAVPVVLMKTDLRWVAAAGAVGELLALAASQVRLTSKHGVPLRDCVLPGGLLAALAVAAWLTKAGFGPTQNASTLALALLGCVVTLGLFIASFADLRRATFSLLYEAGRWLKGITKGVRLRGAPSGA